MKFTLSEIKENLQGTNSGGEEAGFELTIWDIKKKEALNKNSKRKK